MDKWSNFSKENIFNNQITIQNLGPKLEPVQYFQEQKYNLAEKKNRKDHHAGQASTFNRTLHTSTKFHHILT